MAIHRFKKGAPRPKNAGRKKGVPNKTTREVREVFKQAFDKLGGVEALVKWARKTPVTRGEFYRLYARLIPTEIVGPGGGPIQLEVAERDRLRDQILEAPERLRKEKEDRILH
jgi:hypothetical protein